MTMWNDTDEPLAYLITFRTYGTWLHGDERGSTSRHHNKFNSSKLPHEPNWLEINKSRLADKPVILDQHQREIVRAAIKETCTFRGWSLLAVNVRSNHAHSVITARLKSPGNVLNAIKANSTRLLRESGRWMSSRSPWSDKGSTRYLWNDNSVGRACHYVEYEQGDNLPSFE